MAAESSWSLRGVDPRARDVARSAAKREGVTIGEWLNRQLLEEGEGSGGSPEGERRERDSHGDAEHLARVLDKLSRRIEAAEHRSTLAITSIDQSVLSVLTRLQGAEELQTEFADRYQTALEELRETQEALHARIEAMERDGVDAGGLEALKSLEGALEKVAKQVYDGEAETKARLEALKSDLERAQKRSGERIDGVSRALDERIAGVERKMETDVSGVSDTVAREMESAARKATRDLEALDKRLSKEIREAREDSTRVRRETEELVADRADAGRGQIEALEGAVEGVAARLEDVERDGRTTAQRLEGAVETINGRLGEAERVTDSAIKALGQSFTELDARMRKAEDGAETAEAREAFAAEIERRFEGLSRELADVVTATRAEIASEMVEVARQEGAAAVEAQLAKLGSRVTETEARQRSTLERISAEVGKLAGAVEARLHKSDAEAKARISDLNAALVAAQETPAAQAAELQRLQARVKETEAKSSAAAEAISRRLEALDGRLAARGEEIGEDLARRIREAEERTRAMLDGALADVNRRLDHVDDHTAATLSPVQRALDALHLKLEALEGGAPLKPNADAPTERKAAAYPDEDSFTFVDFGIDEGDQDALEIDAGDDAIDFDLPDLPSDDDIAEAGGDAETSPETSPETETDFAPAPDDEFEGALAGEHDELEADEEFSLDFDDLEPAPASPAPPLAPAEGATAGDDGEDAFELVLGRSLEEDAPAARDAEEAFDPFVEDEPPSGEDSGRRARTQDEAANNDEELPGFGPAEEPPGKTKKGRSLLFAAGGLAFLAVGAAGVIVLRDSSRTGPESDGTSDNPLDGLFTKPDATPAPAPAPAPVEPVEAADNATTADAAPEALAEALAGALAGPFAERSIPVDLADAAGGDFSLYAAGGELFVPVRPEDAATGPALDALLSGAGGAPDAATAEAPAAEAPAPAPASTAPAKLTLAQAADAGDPVAAYMLGASRLAQGDLESAIPLIQAAAEGGQAAAQYRLGKLHETGQGVGVDLPEARRLYEAAAAAGNRDAMYALGVLAADGRGALSDMEAAARWFEEAALLGVTDAQFNLAVLYDEGLGVPDSPSDAYAWFSIAAATGDEEAMRRAETVAAELTPQARARAEDAARRFTPRPLDQAANGMFPDAPWSPSSAASAPVAATVAATAAPDATAITTGTGTGTDQLARAQAALARLGYAPGPADGVRGAQTEAAIRAYQTDRNLAATGEVDPALLEMLEADAGAL